MKRLFCLVLTCFLLLPMAPSAGGYEIGEAYEFDLSAFLDNPKRRRFVEMMLDYQLRHNEVVQQTLEEGYTALFFFDGCSDNMDDGELWDISYYRVSAVCVAVRLGKDGEPYIVYFNENGSTLPDRPLSYGAWYFADVGKVGPATICDGTYELYSVKHAGAYEALHMRTTEEDASIEALYMMPEGYVSARATEINIHTRNVNHILERAMWSAGCILVGDGDFGQFTELMESAYYSIYEEFDIGRRVGCVTVNRQFLKEQLYDLYENEGAVELLLEDSTRMLPQKYLDQCSREEEYPEPVKMQTAREAQLMTLPCSNETDARSKAVVSLPEETEVELTGRITNTRGGIWYEVSYEEEKCYIYSALIEQISPKNWLERMWEKMFG